MLLGLMPSEAIAIYDVLVLCSPPAQHLRSFMEFRYNKRNVNILIWRSGRRSSATTSSSGQLILNSAEDYRPQPLAVARDGFQRGRTELAEDRILINWMLVNWFDVTAKNSPEMEAIPSGWNGISASKLA